MVLECAATPEGSGAQAMQRHDIQFPPKDAALREDVHELGALVGEVLREQGGEELFELVEGDRRAAIRRRDGEPEGAEELTIRVRGRPPALARDLVRAFSTWFQAVNLAEKVHRIRRRRQYFVSESAPQPQGVGDCLAKLRQATARYHDLDAAIAAGYTVWSPDPFAPNAACPSSPGGNMGYHLVNVSLRGGAANPTWRRSWRRGVRSRPPGCACR